MHIGKWIRGWFKHAPNGDIAVKDAATKVVNIIDQVFYFWAKYEPIFDALSSDNGVASVVSISNKLSEIQDKLKEIQTLPDISDSLKDYVFSKDVKENEFIHNLISTGAIAFNDGKISIFEATSFVAQIALYLKEHKTEDTTL